MGCKTIKLYSMGIGLVLWVETLTMAESNIWNSICVGKGNSWCEILFKLRTLENMDPGCILQYIISKETSEWIVENVISSFSGNLDGASSLGCMLLISISCWLWRWINIQMECNLTMLNEYFFKFHIFYLACSLVKNVEELYLDVKFPISNYLAECYFPPLSLWKSSETALELIGYWKCLSVSNNNLLLTTHW